MSYLILDKEDKENPIYFQRVLANKEIVFTWKIIRSHFVVPD